MSKLQVAVLVENHEYDVVGLQKMLDSFTDCECYVQPLDLFIRDEKNRDQYDTVLWYNMNIPIPDENSALRDYMENSLGSTCQGIVLIHHALLCFKHWDLYTEVSGVSIRLEDGLFSYHQNTPVTCRIKNASHPVMQGLTDFDIVDETYVIGEPDQPGNDILITAECSVGIKNIGWSRTYKNSRVFVTASGHDDQVYANPHYRQLIHNAILWTGNRDKNTIYRKPKCYTA